MSAEFSRELSATGVSTQRSLGLRWLWRARGFSSILLILIVWEVFARASARTIFLPPVSLIVQRWVGVISDGTLVTAVAISSYRAFAALLLAALLGVILGIAMARVRIIYWFFDPLISIGFPTPNIALVPAFILWFGIGHSSKIMLAAYACFFPMVISAYAGARSVNRFLLWSARSLGASESEVLRNVILPASLPFVFSGIRVALPVSLVVVFVAEMVAGGGGLGYVEVAAARVFKIPDVYAALFTILVLGFALDKLLSLAGRHLLAWHHESTMATEDE